MKKLLLIIAVMAITFTQAQVSLVQDFNLGVGDGMPTFDSNRLSFNGNLIFATYNGINHGVWIINGSSTLPVLLENFTDSTITPQYFTYSMSNNRVYFTGQSDTAGKSSLWQYIGITGSTFEVPSTSIKEIKYITEYQNKVYYQGNTSFGYELHYTDASTPGAVYNLNNIGSSSPEELTSIVNDSRLFYSAIANSTSGRELFMHLSVNNSNTEITINPTGDSNPKDFVTFNNKVYFSADNGTNGRELWVSDRTIAGTQMILDLNTGATGSNPENLTVYNNALYFTATHPTLGTEIFKMNTTENITLLNNIANGGASSSPSDLFVFNNKLYFSADDLINGREIWTSTGFPSTTSMLKDINTSPATPDSNPNGFTPYYGELFFSANNDTNGRELWKTDGTTAGTVLVSDINLSGDSNPEALTVAGDNLYFSATTPSTGKELFKYIDPSLSVDNLELKKSILLYPNPTTNNFSIETNHQIKEVTIYDIQGQFVKTFVNQQDNYSINDIEAGLYFVNIQTSNSTISKKLIKK
ncbi:ELWxxDGT repeat protein [Psychroserpens sp. AS72]|uniref:ELWxxDGT repeat protein n=1 Tax=Psychroserpens sp. AS72 TaxID=3135775 RepID=UPI003171F34E